MSRRILYLLVCCFSLINLLEGSDKLSLPAIHPSTVVPYDVDQGLLTSCVVESFTDPKGRLWINPCRKQDMHKGESFFQFDGNTSYSIAMPEVGGGAEASSWFVSDITAEGILFGANLSYSHVFFYNPDTDEKQVVPFEKGERILNVLNLGDGALIVIVQRSNDYSLYQVTSENKERLGTVPVTFEREVNNYRLPACLSKDKLWFIHESAGFVQYDLKKKAGKIFQWKDLLNTEIGPLERSNLFLNAKGEVTFYVNTVDRCFDFDPESEQLIPNQTLDQLLQSLSPAIREQRRLYFHQDKAGNTLIEVTIPMVNNKVVPNPVYLLDASNKLYRYHLGFGEPAEPKRLGYNYEQPRILNGGFIHGWNFREQAFITTDLGLIVLEYEEDLALQSYANRLGSRAVIQYDSNKVAVVTDRVNVTLIDLTSSTFTDQGIYIGEVLCGESIFAPGQSQVTHEGKENIWLSSEGRLVRFEKAQKTCTTYPVGPNFRKFTFINEREIALVTEEHDLLVYNIDRTQSRPFLHQGNTLNLDEKANELYFSREGLLWIASLNGLWQVNIESGEVSHFTDKNGLTDNRVICIHEARDGKLWIGMIGGGLQVYDPATGTFKLIDKSMGLSNNSVVGILEDKDGDKWVSTFSGITVLSNEGDILFKLHEKDGLSHKEFNRFSYHELEDGRFVFGAVSGVNILDPLKIKRTLSQRKSPQLYLTEISYFNRAAGKDSLLRANFDDVETITLPATHRYLNLNFSLSDYVHVESSSYAYQLVPIEEQNLDQLAESAWINIGNTSYLTLDNLPFGEHILLIRAMDNTGQFIDSLIRVPVSVNNFFYKTWWFYLLCSLPFVMGIFLWNRRLVSEKKRLETEVEKRTHQIRQDKQLIEEQANKLRELDKMKSRFFTNISHEFRTHLTIINSITDRVKANPNLWLEKGDELIIRNSEHLLSLINQILDLRKLEAGALQADMIQGDIITYLHYIIDTFLPLAQSKGIRIHFLTNLKELEMDYDPGKKLQILSNLLSNAIKYSPDGTDIYLLVDHKQTEEAEELIIQLKDTGPGIAPEALPHIFDRFYQVQGQGQRRSQGSGVGLALVKELVELLNGTIEVVSKVNTGTQFKLRFPIHREAPKQELGLSSSQHETSTQSVPSGAFVSNGSQDLGEAISNGLPIPVDLPQLLIVEDNEDVRFYLKNCLAAHYELSFAENGQQGIDHALAEIPDIIVSDIMMPEKDGYELCDILKADNRTSHIPIILLTAKADFESKMKGLRKEADAYLTKPFQQEELLVTLTNQLEVRRKLQLKYASLALDPVSDSSVDQNPAPSLEDLFIQRLQEIVISQIDNPNLSSDYICKEMGMSNTNIYRKLKALTNLSLVHFIRQIRLQRAKELLLDPKLTISEVAYEVGYADPSYFSRIFSETFEQSPSQFRNS